jgi:hypothetical protein
MSMREMALSLKQNGFIQNPNTLKWEKHGVNTKDGELPTAFMSEEVYRVNNPYIRKKNDNQ